MDGFRGSIWVKINGAPATVGYLLTTLAESINSVHFLTELILIQIQNWKEVLFVEELGRQRNIYIGRRNT